MPSRGGEPTEGDMPNGASSISPGRERGIWGKKRGTSSSRRSPLVVVVMSPVRAVRVQPQWTDIKRYDSTDLTRPMSAELRPSTAPASEQSAGHAAQRGRRVSSPSIGVSGNEVRPFTAPAFELSHAPLRDKRLTNIMEAEDLIWSRPSSRNSSTGTDHPPGHLPGGAAWNSSPRTAAGGANGAARKRVEVESSTTVMPSTAIARPRTGVRSPPAPSQPTCLLWGVLFAGMGRTPPWSRVEGTS